MRRISRTGKDKPAIPFKKAGTGDMNIFIIQIPLGPSNAIAIVTAKDKKEAIKTLGCTIKKKIGPGEDDYREVAKILESFPIDTAKMPCNERLVRLSFESVAG